MTSTRILLALTLASVLVGTLVRFALLDGASLWLDELWTLDAVSRTFREMVGARLVSDQSPPLGTSAAWAWLNLVGTYDAHAMRSLPLAFGVAAIVGPVVGAIKMARLRETFAVMAALLAVSAFAIHYSVELRPYAPMIAFESGATVIWAGLLTRQLPRTIPYLFAFAVLGALGGFTHYYGNLAYGAESAILFVALLLCRERRLLVAHLAIAALSLVPVVGWYVFTRPWAPNEAVAGPPSLGTMGMVMDYALAPVTTALRNGPQGYPAITQETVWVLVLLAGAVLAALARALRRRSAADDDGSRSIGLLVASATAATLLGAATAFVASVVLPPSMNFRNLSALLPVILLGVAATVTAVPVRVRGMAGSAVVVVFLLALGVVINRHGIESLAPPWQQSAGYRDTARMLIEASSARPAPQLIGIETAWQWHGHWDAVLRSELGSPPAVSSDDPPMRISWIRDTGSVSGLDSEPTGAVLFTDTTDERWETALTWAEAHYAGCNVTTLGGMTAAGPDSFGVVTIATCE